MTRWPNIKVLPDGFRADLTECAHRNITEGVPSLAGAWPAKRTKPPNHPMHSISAALRTDFALHMACHCHNRSRKRNANVNAAIDLTIDPANDPERQGENCRTQAFFGEKWCMCFVLLGGGRIGAKLPETQTIFNAALTIAAQMLRAFQAFLVDNFYRVPRGPCHRQLASKQASQRQKIHKPTAGHSSLPSVAVLLQLYHSRCFRLLQKSFLEHLSSKGREIGGRSSVSMVALN